MIKPLTLSRNGRLQVDSAACPASAAARAISRQLTAKHGGAVAGHRNFVIVRQACDRSGDPVRQATADFDALARPCPFNSMAPVSAIADLVADHRRGASMRIVTPLERLRYSSHTGPHLV